MRRGTVLEEGCVHEVPGLVLAACSLAPERDRSLLVTEVQAAAVLVVHVGDGGAVWHRGAALERRAHRT